MAKSKIHKIRWTDEDYQRLNKAVRNFNAKISRLEKKNPEIKNSLPEKVSKKEMKEAIISRNDLNREIKSLQRFSKRPRRGQHAKPEDIVTIKENVNGEKITRWQYNEMKKATRRINKMREERKMFVELVPQTWRGKQLGYNQAQIGISKEEMRNLDPIVAFTEKQKPKEIKKKQKTIRRNASEGYYGKYNRIYRENFIEMFSHNYNTENPKVQKLIEHIKKMDDNEFLYKAYSVPGKIFEATNMFKTDLVIDIEEQEGYITQLEQLMYNDVSEDMGKIYNLIDEKLKRSK